MIDSLAQAAAPAELAAALRDELAGGDAMLGTVAPILRHLLANDEHALFGDEVIAAMRGMLADLARQLLEAAAPAHGGAGEPAADPAEAALIAEFTRQPALLSHLHALALEAQLARRLETRLALDPVLSPLLQALIASNQPGVAGSAMALLAAQARFVQNQRRMHLPLGELPGDLLHLVLLALRGLGEGDAQLQARAEVAEQQIRRSYDEGRSRLGLIARLVLGMGGGVTAALSLTHAGAAIFLSALAIASGQDRALAVLSTSETQVARLALALRAAGLKPAAIAEQFEILHPDVTLPPQFELLGPDEAVALLSRAVRFPGADPA